MSFVSSNVNSQPSSDVNPISLKHLDALIDISFNSVSKDTKVNTDLESRFVKVGGLTYKFLAADPLEGSDKDAKALKDQITNQSFEQEMKARSADQLDPNEPTPKPTDQDKDFTLYAAINHGLVIRLLPQNPLLFLEDLNGNLRNFIKDTVEIIRNLDKNEYQFKFGKMDLEVHIRHDENKLFVQLVRGKNGDIPMLTEEDRINLINLLQKDYPDEEIEVNFVEGFQETLFQKDSEEGNSKQEQEETTESLDDEFSLE
ncbi:hypothetical protein DID80_02475 [Candidatus Marinamargulisbacteria bacterium SCGC AAA071-K20]|nr:hypothetical protein DID80_02475 [Candidatus Marinamargulisbacteria bacterium SCGC AAA071-K20]